MRWFQLWDISYDCLLETFSGLSSAASALALAQDHRSFAATSAEGDEVLLWDLSPNHCICHGENFNSLKTGAYLTMFLKKI